MKKVRFVCPHSISHTAMDNECLSPRPFTEVPVQLNNYDYAVYSQDPMVRFESSNSCPYPKLARPEVLTAKHSYIPEVTPSNELDLSILDSSSQVPRNCFQKTNINIPVIDKPQDTKCDDTRDVLKPVINNVPMPNTLANDDNFFLKRNESDLFQHAIKLKHDQKKSNDNKENSLPLEKKTKLLNPEVCCDRSDTVTCNRVDFDSSKSINKLCGSCILTKKSNCTVEQICGCCQKRHKNDVVECTCLVNRQIIPLCNEFKKLHVDKPDQCLICNCNSKVVKQKVVNKKNWKLEHYEINKNIPCSDIVLHDKSADNSQPTVADLYKIIQAQNEQLKLLQEKVDNIVSKNITTQNNQQVLPIENFAANVQTVENENHKISIGVMTSFEVIRSSTVFNKEFLTKTNTQVQCNQSYINITGVAASKETPMRILDGISPQVQSNKNIGLITKENQTNDVINGREMNEMSVCNVQIDDAVTPMLSPEQSMYLDIQDYSRSTSSSRNDRSNVGWTYYNKVMTHVNGMLQDSDMPSSASALYRNTRQHCMQMQIDKTDISISKRVTFNDDPLGFHRKVINPAIPTETSIKMNQLAMKYLNVMPAPTPVATRQFISPPLATDMSIATRNYMEKHHLFKDNHRINSPPELPKFLDITTLKKQPKLL